MLEAVLRCLLPAGGAALRMGRLKVSLPMAPYRDSSGLGRFSEELGADGGDVCAPRAFNEPEHN